MPDRAGVVAIKDVMAERSRQVGLWGQQDHPPALWLAILTEEVGEVAREVAEVFYGPPSPNYRTELVHVAAVAVAAIESLDRKNESLEAP